MKRRGRADHLLVWTKSSQWRAICRAQARRNLAAWKAMPRCGALARSTGEPCRNPAKAGYTRCRFHGTTPKGDNWHRPSWPQRDQLGANTKLNRKLNDLQRAAAKRQKRIKRMSPEQRIAYDEWRRTHAPGSAAARERQREYRRQDRETRLLLSSPKPPSDPTPEARELQNMLDELKAQLAKLEIEQRKGVFG
jgi:hypothetical protein